MATPEVNKRLLSELESMGFPVAQATRALHHSGNSSLEAAVTWIIDHEDQLHTDEIPLVPVNIDIEASKPAYISEQVKLKAEELRVRAHRRKEGEEKTLERDRERVPLTDPCFRFPV